MKEIAVSIICNTYNQEKYIADALDSFLMQKTNFAFEVLVNDDASTDKTPDIIREYGKKYPDIIRPVCQKENLYSKNVKITVEVQIPRAKGKYVALCEGDDYWTDENKLQKQYDYMENHPECFLCAHGGHSVDSETKVYLKSKGMERAGEYHMVDAIKGFGRICATNSFFYRKEMYNDLPEYFNVAPCGDYVIPIRCLEMGTVVYMKDDMAAYRVRAKNSLSESWTKNPEALRNYYLRYDEMLKKIDEHLEYKYAKEIKEEHTRIWFTYYMAVGDKKKLKEPEFRAYMEKHSFSQRLKYKINLNFPKMAQRMIKAKYFIKKLIHR